MLVATILFVYLPGAMPPYLLGLLLGIGSGAAMIPYSIIKEVNPDEVKGSATGAINFLVFTLSALLAPGLWLAAEQPGGWRQADARRVPARQRRGRRRHRAGHHPDAVYTRNRARNPGTAATLPPSSPPR